MEQPQKRKKLIRKFKDRNLDCIQLVPTLPSYPYSNPFRVLDLKIVQS